MSRRIFSLIIWCRYDVQNNINQVRIVRADTGELVHLGNDSFLMRITTDTLTAVERCSIQHIATGREAYLQAGPHLRAFINDCVLHTENNESGTSRQPEE